jgi:hypothetical protein
MSHPREIGGLWLSATLHRHSSCHCHWQLVIQNTTNNRNAMNDSNCTLPTATIITATAVTAAATVAGGSSCSSSSRGNSRCDTSRAAASGMFFFGSLLPNYTYSLPPPPYCENSRARDTFRHISRSGKFPILNNK